MGNLRTPKGLIPYKDYSNIDMIILPHIRLLWANIETPSGTYLQLGFELKTTDEETIGRGYIRSWVMPETSRRDSIFYYSSW